MTDRKRRRNSAPLLALIDELYGAEIAAEADTTEAVAGYDEAIGTALEATDRSSPAPERVAGLRAVCEATIGRRWRRRYDRVRAEQPVPATVADGAEVPRETALAHLDRLRARHPALVAHHRDLDTMSDALLASLVVDIEAVAGAATAAPPLARVPAPSGREHARRVASTIIARLGIERAEDLDIDAIAQVSGAEVVFGPLPGALARVVSESRTRIRLSDAMTHPGQIRFSIAHELGHLWLHHDRAALARLCTADDLDTRERDPRGPALESDANAFAAELLMPAPLVAPWSRQPDLSLDTARDLARAFRVSVTAAALRLVELTAEPCAVVWTRASRVVRVSRSATFPALVEVGEAPGPDSGVVEHAAWGRMARAERHVSAETWLAAAAPVGSGIAEQGTTLPGSDDLLVFLRLVEDGLRD